MNELQHEKHMFPIVLSGSVAPIMDDDMTSLHGVVTTNNCQKRPKALPAAYDDAVHYDDVCRQRPTVCTQLSTSCYLLIRSKLKLKQPTSSFISLLHDVKNFSQFDDRFENEEEGGFLLLAFVYRKAIRYALDNAGSPNRR